MAGPSKKIGLEIEGQNKTNNAVNEAMAELKKLGDAADAAAKNSASTFEKFSAVATGLNQSFQFATATASKLYDGFKAITSAAAESERAESRRARQMKISGEFSEAAMRHQIALADAIAKTTTLEDEDVLALQTRMQAMGVTNAEMEEATRAAVGLAKTYEIDLQKAGQIVGKVLDGNVSSLKRFGIEAGSTEEAMAQLVPLFAQAEDEAKTLEGTIVRFERALGNLFETVSKAGADAGGQSFFDRLTKGIENLTTVLDEKIPKIQQWWSELQTTLGDSDSWGIEAAFSGFTNPFASITDGIAATEKLLADEAARIQAAEAPIEAPTPKEHVRPQAKAAGGGNLAAARAALGFGDAPSRWDADGNLRPTSAKTPTKVLEESDPAFVGPSSSLKSYYAPIDMGPPDALFQEARNESLRRRTLEEEAHQMRAGLKTSLANANAERRMLIEPDQVSASEKMLTAWQGMRDTIGEVATGFNQALGQGLMQAIMQTRSLEDAMESLLSTMAGALASSAISGIANIVTGGIFGGIGELFGLRGGGTPVRAASGRIVRGGTPGVDSVHALLTPDEAVLTPELTRELRRILESPGPATGPIARFARGGIVPSSSTAGGITLVIAPRVEAAQGLNTTDLDRLVRDGVVRSLERLKSTGELSMLFGGV